MTIPKGGSIAVQQASSYTCLGFSSGILLVGKSDGGVMVLKNGLLVAQLNAVPKSEVSFKDAADGTNHILAVVAVAAFGSGFVAATAGGNVAVFASVRRGGCGPS